MVCIKKYRPNLRFWDIEENVFEENEDERIVQQLPMIGFWQRRQNSPPISQPLLYTDINDLYPFLNLNFLPSTRLPPLTNLLKLTKLSKLVKLAILAKFAHAKGFRPKQFANALFLYHPEFFTSVKRFESYEKYMTFLCRQKSYISALYCIFC